MVVMMGECSNGCDDGGWCSNSCDDEGSVLMVVCDDGQVLGSSWWDINSMQNTASLAGQWGADPRAYRAV